MLQQKVNLLYKLILVLVFIFGVLSHSQCNMYPYSPLDCVQKTQKISCQYDYSENSCIETKETNLGCAENLNKDACLSQLRDVQNNRVFCIFTEFCRNVKKVQQEQFKCSEMFNKYACLTVEKQLCTWENGRCKQLQEIVTNNSNLCNIFRTPVTPYTCSLLPSGMSSDFEGNFQCAELNSQQLSQLSCHQLGLNEVSCLRINKINQYCAFEDYQCIEIKLSEIKSCNQKISLDACLSIENIDLKCEWVDNKCRTFQESSEYDCLTQNQVNVSVCQLSSGLCQYNISQHKCFEIDKKYIKIIPCDTPGLSKLACLSIKNQACSFVNGKCQRLSELDLNRYKCDMELNRLACLSIKTHFQYCFWDGTKCERRIINQDYNCPLELENNTIRVNGNVCQAISKDGIRCKYNESTNLCIKSSIQDSCNTAYINKFGCVSTIQNDEACQWTNQGCKLIQVIKYNTTCASLGSANPFACSQVHEKDEMVGCYFDDKKLKCVTLQVNLAANATKIQIQQYQKDQELLKNIDCNQIGIGLNRIACSCITKKNTACKWNRNQCVYIKNRKDIQTIQCLDLKYSNYQVCAFASYNDEICRYSKNVFGCVNSLVKHMQCNEIGLNSIGCQQAEGKCQFQNNQCQEYSDSTQSDIWLDDDQVVQPPISSLKCSSTSPSKQVCVSFSSSSLLCQWNKSNLACEDVEIKQNQKCLDFAGIDVAVNKIVCINIINDFPDYDISKGIQVDRNRGYCYYNRFTFQCQIKKELCNTKCCTENENQGMNPHACSKFSSNEPGDYCYFMNSVCQELTDDVVDLSDPIQIQQYYDENKLPCYSMNKNSCHMISWSVEQLCYYNGSLCNLLNYIYYNDNKIFTQEPAILNQYACFGIDGIITENNSLKYIIYDYENKRCKEFDSTNEISYASCEDVKGNRNVCQRFSGNNYCKWDKTQLKCVTIPFDEYDEIQTCDSELNVKACTDIKKSSCVFSYHLDKCIDVTNFNVDCNYFDTIGKVSWQVCLQIEKVGQQCEFQNYSCITSTKISETCDGSLANNRSCFKNTRGLCRWDPITFQCYINYTDISILKCTDNINKELCIKITTQSCIWNDQSNECQEFNPQTSTEFDKLNQTGDHQFNESACLLITGDAYYYDKIQHKCIKLISTTVNCNEFQMNKYACLYHTRTHYCFYDEQEVIPNNKCKQFIEDQTKCETNWLINIEVCMDIYHPCVFDLSTLLCKSYDFQSTMTCSQLQQLSMNQQHPNKITCSSVFQTLDQSIEEQLCSEDLQNKQQCKFEKYCLWNNYSCQIFNTVYDYRESSNAQQKTIKECPDFQQSDFCPNEVIQNEQSLYFKERLSNMETNWQFVNDTCIQRTLKFERQITYYQISDQLRVCQIKLCNLVEEQFCNEELEDLEIVETIIPYYEIETDSKEASHYHITSINDDLDTCNNLDCSQESDYDCNTAKIDCEQKINCQKELTYPYRQISQDTCQQQTDLIFSYWCHLQENKVYICSNVMSKALCLELGQGCYFDIQQGGCRYLDDNQHNILNCDQIANTCNVSSRQKLICQKGSQITIPGGNCKALQKSYTFCLPLTTYNAQFSCQNIKSQDAQPSLCAMANDDCRFDGTVCISSKPTINSNGKYPCDKSFSQSLCVKCGCDYEYLGYCQQTKQLPQISQDGSNKYLLCYQVNLLETTFKEEICGKVDQACAFHSGNCQDATHFDCIDLLFTSTVSLKACLKCQQFATKYITNEQKCHKIDVTPQFSCENLNKYACIRNTTGVKCKWENQSCQTISIQASDIIECSVLNQDGCYSKQVNTCWIEDVINLKCVKFDPYKGQCQQLLTESLCIRSMLESCKWSQNKCVKNNSMPVNTCDNLNRYQCLIQDNIACGWSDVYEKCYQLQFKQDATSCNDFLSNDQSSFINFYNSYTCTQIKAQLSCIHDQYYYKCREVIPTDPIPCINATISKINQFACVNLSQGKCKFNQSKCEQTNQTNLGCQSYLNKEACLIQDSACKFDTYCSIYKIQSLQDIRTLFPYTQGVCKASDLTIKSTDGNLDIGIALIYSVAQQKCLDISNKDMPIKSCTYVGMNRYSCLLKTNQYCEFLDGSCKSITVKEIQKLNYCKESLNQYACTKLNVKCKFKNNKCQNLVSSDNCITLSRDKSIVNFRACLEDDETPCQYISSTQNCEVITTPQKCPGLNRKGCLFVTQGYYCEFKDSQCILSFGNRNCTDHVNQYKCLSIITNGQYCYFDQKYGCKDIDTKKVDLSSCQKDIQTNPFTCSKSTDIPCFFDKQTMKCIPFTEKTESSYQQNYSISNIYSFNKKTCQIFNELKALMWQESCQIVTSSQLVYLKCSAILNKISCLSIKTPFQFCQYENNKCINKNLDDFRDAKCDTIKNINSGAFCTMTNDQACQFNKSLFKCEIIEQTETINCVEKDPEEKGINKLGCMRNVHCIFDENCYRLNFSRYQFCKDINDSGEFQCKQVTNEGCMIQSDGCKKIYYQSYYQIHCEQASNRFGCVNIQTNDQFCQFNGNECNQQDVKQYSEMNCLSIVNINHYIFCEKPTDIACTFDLKNNCCRNVYPQEEFSCERGLNKIACLTQTTKSLMCQFLDYCYGPNNGILNCQHEDTNKCCREADQIDTCLNQKIYECEWTSNGCQGLQNRIDECDNIVNASFLVCSSIKSKLCIYVASEHKCKSQNPTTCGYCQTNKQCKRMKSISCLWNANEEVCSYSDESNYYSCSYITQSSGNQRACMNVEVQGQMCIFKDESCILFVQQENANNCLDTINKIACLQQTISNCYWNEQVYRVQKYLYQDEEEIIYGECKPITNIHQISCSQNISYTACQTVTKLGEFCIWKDFKCQHIIVDEQILYTPNSLNQINQNACSLVNNGDKVKYDHRINGCVIIQNLNDLTCKPPTIGINKDACLSIKTQTCAWNNNQKNCFYLDIIDTQEICHRPGWTSLSCTKLDINQPCGYKLDGCQIVDTNTVSCTHPGLNKYACLNIKNYPCIWKLNDQNLTYFCDDYIPYTSCKLILSIYYYLLFSFSKKKIIKQISNICIKFFELFSTKLYTIYVSLIPPQNHFICLASLRLLLKLIILSATLFNTPIIPNNINPKVCQLVEQDACYFDIQNQKCNSDLTSANCDTMNLNIQGCVQIDGCFYNEYCQYQKNDNYSCENYPIANHKVCQNAQDSCKFNELTFGCSQAKFERCDTKGLSKLGCSSQQECLLDNDKCYCTISINYDCNFIKNKDKCDSHNHCIFKDNSYCKWKECEDIYYQNCSNMKQNGSHCYLNTSQQCMSAKSCEDIKNPYYTCPDINSNHCILNKSSNQCNTLNCEIFTEEDCQKYSNYCTFDMEKSKCNNKCKNDICEEQIECSNYSDKQSCEQKIYNNRQCQWVLVNKESFCTNTICRFLTTQQCIGKKYHEEVCVLLNDYTCVSCEEITNACICLQKAEYCEYDFYESQCKSISCSKYKTKEQCPKNYCQYFDMKCIQNCAYLYNSETCLQQTNCQWMNGMECQNKIKEQSNDGQTVLNNNLESIKLIFLGSLALFF